MSLDDPYKRYILCGPLPCAHVPLIAPIWTDLDFRARGAMFYRTSQDPAILNQIARSIAEVNPVLSDYRPTQAVIVTWFEALSHYDDVSICLLLLLGGSLTNSHKNFTGKTSNWSLLFLAESM